MKKIERMATETDQLQRNPDCFHCIKKIEAGDILADDKRKSRYICKHSSCKANFQKYFCEECIDLHDHGVIKITKILFDLSTYNPEINQVKTLIQKVHKGAMQKKSEF